MSATDHPLVQHVRWTEPELSAFGESLGRRLHPPALVTLSGDLGAGKTTLIRAMCRGYGVTSEVTSPTYALVHVYEGGPSEVFHLDLFRLRDASELTNIGWYDILTEQALILVEWPERAAGEFAIAVPTVRIRLAHVAGDAGSRDVEVRES